MRMRTIVYCSLSISIVLEIVVVLAILSGSAAIAPLWAFPVFLLIVTACLLIFWTKQYWEDMGSPEKAMMAVSATAPLLPIAAAVVYLVVIVVAVIIGVILAVVLAVFLLGAVGDSAGSGGGARHTPTLFGQLRDGYGNRTGWVDRTTGEITDQYGNREGWINPNGEITDAYGNREGWINPNGEITDAYGNRTGSIS